MACTANGGKRPLKAVSPKDDMIFSTGSVVRADYREPLGCPEQNTTINTEEK